MIDVAPAHLHIILNILKTHTPDCEVRVFGSRFQWTAKDFSDLDLAVVGREKLALKKISALRIAFEESPLPYRVDVLDWHAISPAFQNVIEQGYEVIQKAGSDLNSNGWIKRKLSDVCKKIGSGATPRGGNDVYVSHGKVALIRSQNVYNDGFRKDGLAYITERHAKELDHVAVEPDDILLNITGDSVARCCQVPDDILPARVNQHVAIIRPQKDKLDARYLRYYLVDPIMQDYMLMLAGGGATRNALTKGMIESFEIPAPPLPEQRAIAGILGALDDKIELNRRMNRTLESMARGVFRQWFVESEEVGDWEVGKLGDVAENIRRSANPDEIDPDTDYVGLEHMPRGSIALSEWGNATELVSNKFIFKEGEFLFGKLRPYFHKVGIAPIDGVCSTDILVIAPKSPEWYGFVLGHISSVELINYTNAASTGTKMPRTNWLDIANYEVAIPPVEKAKDYNEIFLPMAQRIRANIMESRTLANLRDTLLPKLMRGEVRVRA